MTRIYCDPDICGGKPCIEGTRITAQAVLEYVAAGDSQLEIQEALGITAVDFQEVVRYLLEEVKRLSATQENR